MDLRLKAEGEDVVVEVARTGAPIPAEVQPQLFDAFRSESLGLFITREIARAHGGDVEVRSSAEEGTTFRVRLPRGPALVR